MIAYSLCHCCTFLLQLLVFGFVSNVSISSRHFEARNWCLNDVLVIQWCYVCRILWTVVIASKSEEKERCMQGCVWVLKRGVLWRGIGYIFFVHNTVLAVQVFSSMCAGIFACVCFWHCSFVICEKKSLNIQLMHSFSFWVWIGAWCCIAVSESQTEKHERACHWWVVSLLWIPQYYCRRLSLTFISPATFKFVVERDCWKI